MLRRETWLLECRLEKWSMKLELMKEQEMD